MRLSDMTEVEYVAYIKGFEAGERYAINCCFSNALASFVTFDTADEEHAYTLGYERGYASVD